MGKIFKIHYSIVFLWITISFFMEYKLGALYNIKVNEMKKKDPVVSDMYRKCHFNKFIKENFNLIYFSLIE